MSTWTNPADYPIVFMDLALLPADTDIWGLGDFRGWTVADRTAHYNAVATYLHLFQEMAPHLEQGVPPITWDAWDQERDRGPHALTEDTCIGYRRVYEVFYSLGERIEVVLQPNGTYKIINGRRRTWMAREMGIARLPVCILPPGE